MIYRLKTESDLKNIFFVIPIFFFSIYIGTWNVNGQPSLSSLNDWLTCDSELPDIYAIGFQELDLSKEAFLFNDSPREEEWLLVILF